MPELPEVETVRRALELGLEGLQINRVSGRSVGMRRPLDVPMIASRIEGRRFSGARRRGKYLLIDLEGGGSLLVHLGMSGKLLLGDANQPRPGHTHLVLTLSDSRELRFVDPRRFGFAVWLDPGEERADSSLRALGVEPLDPALDEMLPPLLQSRRSPVKSLILDQHLIAGIGNIYAAEALWRAGIRPTRRGCHTSQARLRRLMEEVRTVLQEAIVQGGTTLRDYATPDGNAGYFKVKLNVYGRAGESCPECGATLKDTRISGRSTVWCPTCQR